jgi:hypothetical protein
MTTGWQTWLVCGALVGGAACGGDSGPDRVFSILADRIPGGALLSAATVGDEVFFVGGNLGGGTGVVARYSGDTLCVEPDPLPRALWWIHAPRPGEWYAVGEAGTILHSVDGVRTDESVATSATLYGVWDDGQRVVAVGGDVWDTKEGEVWARDAGTWSLLASGLPGVVFKVWRRWLVGDGVAYTLEGDTLTPHPPPEAARLLTVVGRDDEDVWAVGGASRPVVLRRLASAWSTVEVTPFCATQGLNGVFAAAGDDVWIAGFFGAMGRFDGTDWQCPSQAVTFEHFHAVHRHDDEVLWAGGNLFSPGDNYGTVGRYASDARTLTPVACP